MIALYVVLAVLAIAQGDSSAGIWAGRVLFILAVVHLIETAVFFNLCKTAKGSLGGNLLSVFLFGVLHVKELKAAQGAS